MRAVITIDVCGVGPCMATWSDITFPAFLVGDG
jgi:hypothetical protein